MKDTLQRGLESRVKFDVDRERTIDFMGEDARVYATPMLVRDVEMACRQLLLEHLDSGEDSVGTRVEIDHIAATLLGMPVELTVRVVEVNGRAVQFEIEGRDAVEPIARGRHARFVVDVDRTAQRLAAKAAKAAKAAEAGAAGDAGSEGGV
ncbi:MAG: LysR family transcriptional regulator [Burkholderiales bacterium]|nr:MAG: LysR family transcriptional regulator [Burkholderiales bacterium]